MDRLPGHVTCQAGPLPPALANAVLPLQYVPNDRQRPRRERQARDAFVMELHKLSTGILDLAAPDGRLRTFLSPPDRDGDNWNFCAGEALPSSDCCIGNTCAVASTPTPSPLHVGSTARASRTQRPWPMGSASIDGPQPIGAPLIGDSARHASFSSATDGTPSTSPTRIGSWTPSARSSTTVPSAFLNTPSP